MRTTSSQSVSSGSAAAGGLNVSAMRVAAVKRDGGKSLTLSSFIALDSSELEHFARHESSDARQHHLLLRFVLVALGQCVGLADDHFDAFELGARDDDEVVFLHHL